jgi:hypothetical protein
MSIVTYGNHEIDTDKLPAESIAALVRRGISHYLGNEQAAKVTAWVEAHIKANSGANPTDEAKAAAKADFIAKALSVMLSGEMGTRVSGPRVEPIEAARNSIAKAEVLAILRSAGIKPPKGDEAVKFGDGTEKTLAAMIATRLGNHADRIEKEAAKRLADQARVAKAAKAAVEAAPSKTADALGL